MSLNFTEISPLAAPRVFMSVAWQQGLLYVVGGCNNVGEPVATLEVYDPVKNIWTTKVAMPTKRAAPIVAAFGGKIYAIGGVGETQAPVAAVEVYDVAKETWRKLTSLSEPLMGMAHVVRGDRIDLFGGMGADTNPRDCYKSFVVSDDGERWVAMTPMPTARYSAHAFHLADKIYVVGGRQGKIPVASFEVYDVARKQWDVYPNIPTKRVFPNYAMTSQYIVTLGGLKQSANDGFSDACEMYPIKDESSATTWITHKKQNMPTKRGDFTVFNMSEEKILVCGGIGNQGSPLASMDVYDVTKRKWKRLGDACIPRSTAGSAKRGNKIYLLGGMSTEGATAHCEVCELV